jgi:hypothetical protein
MTTATVHRLNPRQGLMECSECGATAKAGCGCGVAYVPAGSRAAAAVAANPGESDRAIAKKVGVDHKTVAKARRATGDNSPVEARTGRDGKRRKPPKRKCTRPSGPAQDEVQRQASINVRPDDWAAFKRRADAREQSAAAVLGKLLRDSLGAAANGRPVPTIENPVAEVNAFHREIVRFTVDISERLTAWIESKPPIDENGKDAIQEALYLCGTECHKLAQKLDGR